VVVEQVQDLHRGAVSELPGGGIALPHLIWQLDLETNKGAAGPLVGWGVVSPWRLRDAPGGGDRMHPDRLPRRRHPPLPAASATSACRPWRPTLDLTAFEVYDRSCIVAG
jgi:hypothetical protein